MQKAQRGQKEIKRTPEGSRLSGGFLCCTNFTRPTGNLDEDTAQDITEILKESAHKMNKCVVVVTHSNELAKQADVVFRLKKGELQVLERTQDGNAQPQCRRNNAPRNERRAR